MRDAQSGNAGDEPNASRFPKPLGSHASLFSLGGVVLIAIGLFVPIVRLPLLGSRSVVEISNTGNIIALVCFAVLTLIAVVVRSRRVVWIPGSLICFLVGAFYVKIEYAKAAAEGHVATYPSDLGVLGSLFEGVVKLAVGGIRMEWGGGILFLGGLLPLLAACSSLQVAQQIAARGNPFRAASEGQRRDVVAWSSLLVAALMCGVVAILSAGRLLDVVIRRSVTLDADMAVEQRKAQEAAGVVRERWQAAQEAGREREQLRREAESAELQRLQETERLKQREVEMREREAERARADAEEEHRASAARAAERAAFVRWKQKHLDAFVKFTAASDSFYSDLRKSKYSRVKECEVLSSSARLLIDRGITQSDSPGLSGKLTTIMNAYADVGEACSKGNRGRIDRLFFLASTNRHYLMAEDVQ